MHSDALFRPPATKIEMIRNEKIFFASEWQDPLFLLTDPSMWKWICVQKSWIWIVDVAGLQWVIVGRYLE
jgi:hypothetical protein